MIIEQYPYHEIKRQHVDGKRLYSIIHGKALPSVTTILDRTKSEEKKQALANWKKRVGTEQAQQITTEAASRGTRMHKYPKITVSTANLKARSNLQPTSKQNG